jgi:type 1 fimbria pilin
MTMRSLFKFFALTGLTAALPMAASAADLTLRFTGDFKTSTCAFSVPDTDLGTYQATTFTGGIVTPLKSISVMASGCTPDIATVHMALSGTADTNDATLFAVRNTSGNVSGVAIELVNGSGQRVTPNVTRFDWSLAGLGLTYTLLARFSQTRPSVTAGSISTPITIQFTYN